MNYPLMLTYQGQTKTIDEWSALVGINKKTIWQRIRHYHWTINEALGTPANSANKNFIWKRAIDNGVEAWQELMICRGYFRKENRIKVYKMLNTWYKEFLSEDMKVA